MFAERLGTLAAAIAAGRPHTFGACACAACVGHRLVLERTLRQTERNAEYARHLEATRRRARRKAHRAAA